MRATNKSDRTGRVARWMTVATLAAVAAALTGCVTAPAYPGYGAGYGAGYAAGSNAYGNSVGPTSYSSGYDSTYNNGYGSYDPNAPQPYPQQPAPTYSQPQPTYSQPNYSPYPNNGDQSYQAPADNRYGVVEYVEAVPVRGQSSGVGAVLGGVVGACWAIRLAADAATPWPPSAARWQAPWRATPWKATRWSARLIA